MIVALAILSTVVTFWIGFQERGENQVRIAPVILSAACGFLIGTAFVS